MNNGIHPFHKKILKFIDAYQKKRGYPPSVREIAKGVDFSLGGLQYQLDKMEELQLIKRDEKVFRSIRVAK